MPTPIQNRWPTSDIREGISDKALFSSNCWLCPTTFHSNWLGVPGKLQPGCPEPYKRLFINFHWDVIFVAFPFNRKAENFQTSGSQMFLKFWEKWQFCCKWMPDLIPLKRGREENLSKRKHKRSYVYEWFIRKSDFQVHNIHWFFFFLIIFIPIS